MIKVAYRPKGMERIDDVWTISYNEEDFDYKEPVVMVLKTDEIWDIDAHIERRHDAYGGIIIVTNTRANKAILY
jgi:hypothetical protein